LLHSFKVKNEKKSGCEGADFCRWELRTAGLDGRIGGDGNVYITFAHDAHSEIRDQLSPIRLTTSIVCQRELIICKKGMADWDLLFYAGLGFVVSHVSKAGGWAPGSSERNCSTAP
jgi:hypothetical protein